MVFKSLVQPSLAAVLWVCLKSGLRSTATSSNLLSLCTPNFPVLHPDCCQTSSSDRCCTGSSADHLGHLSRRGSRKGHQGLAKGQFSRAGIQQCRLVSCINNTANIRRKLAKELPFYCAVEAFTEQFNTSIFSGQIFHGTLNIKSRHLKTLQNLQIHSFIKKQNTQSTVHWLYVDTSNSVCLNTQIQFRGQTRKTVQTCELSVCLQI